MTTITKSQDFPPTGARWGRHYYGSAGSYFGNSQRPVASRLIAASLAEARGLWHPEVLSPAFDAWMKTASATLWGGR